jgi:hypothetical protein
VAVFLVKLTPKTWIRAPLTSKEQVNRYIQKGWLPKEAEALDRAFPRTDEGKAYIPKAWIEAAMTRAAEALRFEKELVRRGWRIIEKTSGLPKNYVEIDEPPLRYSRAIAGAPKQTVETFEYIDGTYTLSFHIEVEDTQAPKLLQILAAAGEIGLMSRTGKGYGKFKCEVEVEEEKEEKRKKLK